MPKTNDVGRAVGRFLDRSCEGPATEVDKLAAIAAYQALKGQSFEAMRRRTRKTYAAAGDAVVNELFARLDQIEGPGGERPIVTVEYLADNSHKIRVDTERLREIKETVSPAAWRLMRETCVPNVMWQYIQRTGPMRQLDDNGEAIGPAEIWHPSAADAKADLAVITESVDWLLEHEATEIRITETEDGGMEVWGNTEGHPAETDDA